MVEGVSWFVTGVNASYLGKQNSIPPMFRVIQQCGRKHTAILKLALDILTNLTKSSRSPHCLSVHHMLILMSIYLYFCLIIHLGESHGLILVLSIFY